MKYVSLFISAQWLAVARTLPWQVDNLPPEFDGLPNFHLVRDVIDAMGAMFAALMVKVADPPACHRAGHAVRIFLNAVVAAESAFSSPDVRLSPAALWWRRTNFASLLVLHRQMAEYGPLGDPAHDDLGKGGENSIRAKKNDLSDGGGRLKKESF